MMPCVLILIYVSFDTDNAYINKVICEIGKIIEKKSNPYRQVSHQSIGVNTA